VALPLVLPPTVLGFYLLLALGPHSPLGRAWGALTGRLLPFSFPGLLIASVLSRSNVTGTRDGPACYLPPADQAALLTTGGSSLCPDERPRHRFPAEAQPPPDLGDADPLPAQGQNLRQAARSGC
jgi:hypothetical protein